MRLLPVLFAVIFFSTPLLTDGQWKVERGPSEVHTGRSYEAIDLLSKKFFSFENEVVAMKYEDQEFHFQCLDPKRLREKSRSETELEEKKMAHEGTIQIGGELYLLYAWWDKDNEEERLFARKLDRSSCELGSSNKIFGYSENRMMGEKVKAGFLSMKTTDKFDFFSPISYEEDDESRLAARFRIKPGEHDGDDEKFVIGYLVYDQNMELQWSETYEMPYKEDHMDRIGTAVNQEGEVYMLARVREGEDPSDDDAPSHFEVFKFKGDESDFDHAKLELDEDLETEADRFSFEVGPDGGLTFNGFYTHKEQDEVKGVFSSKVDPSGGTTKIKNHPFSEEFITKYEGKRSRKRVERKGVDHPKIGISHLRLEGSRVYNDGDVLLVGEQFHWTSHTINDMEHTDYHYQDIIAARVSPADGELKWIRKLPKEQEGSVEGEDLSIRLFTNDEEAQIIFFDNDKNLELKPEEEPAEHKGQVAGHVTAYRVDHSTGDVTKQDLLDVTNVKGKTLHDYSLDRFVSAGSDKFILEAKDDNDRDLLIGVTF